MNEIIYFYKILFHSDLPGTIQINIIDIYLKIIRGMVLGKLY